MAFFDAAIISPAIFAAGRLRGRPRCCVSLTGSKTMKKPGLPANEEQRLAALRALNVLDTPPEERFDRITRLAKKLFEIPIALITLVDAERQWFKSCQGLQFRETD